MATQRSKLINDAPAWSEKQRYKVNAVVVYNDVVYQNTTGSNSIPSLLTDWIKVSIDDLIDFIPIGGTDVGSPVTGLIKFGYTGDDKFGGIGINPNNDLPSIMDETNNKSVSYDGFIINGNQFAFDSLFGLNSQTDHSSNYDDNTYIQKKYVDNQTGWEQIIDTTYTVGSPLAIASGVTGKILTGAVKRIQTQLPSGVTEFWNNTTKKLMAVNDGDAFTLSLRFKSKMDVANGYADVAINIGGALNVISQETILFLKGADTEQKFDIDLSYFTGTTFIANGGDIEVTPLNGNIEIYDIVLVPIRTHKGK